MGNVLGVFLIFIFVIIPICAVAVPIIAVSVSNSKSRQQYFEWLEKVGMKNASSVGEFIYDSKRGLWCVKGTKRLFNVSDINSVRVRSTSKNKYKRYEVHIELNLLNCPFANVDCGNSRDLADKTSATIKILRKQVGAKSDNTDREEKSDDVSKY